MEYFLLEEHNGKNFIGDYMGYPVSLEEVKKIYLACQKQLEVFSTEESIELLYKEVLKDRSFSMYIQMYPEEFEEDMTTLVVRAAKSSKKDRKKPEPIPGYVYLAQAKGLQRFKIGRSSNPVERGAKLKRQSPVPVEVIWASYFDDCRKTEVELHDIFSSKRVHGEWFELSNEDVNKILTMEEVKTR